MHCVIDIPAFSLQAVLRREDTALYHRATGLLRQAKRQSVIAELTAPARVAGVRVGMTAAQATARCSRMILRMRDEEAEEAAGRALFAAAYATTPRIEMTAKGLCTIDLNGTQAARWETCAQTLRDRLAVQGFYPRLGFAEKPAHARYAARRANDDPGFLIVDDPRAFLNRMPLDAAEPPDALRKILARWGIDTVGAFLRLDRQAVGERLGAEGLTLWDEAAGRHQQPLDIAAPPTRFHEACEWEYEVDTLEPLLFILRRFLDQLTSQLEAAGRVAGALRLRLKLTDAAPYTRTLTLPEPTRDPGTLFRVLQTHLETLRTANTLAGAALDIQPVEPHNRQIPLFDATIRNPWRFADTLDRLAAIAGPENVGTPRLENTHRPDAFRLEPLPRELACLTKPPTLPPGLTLRRWRPPIPARVQLIRNIPSHLEAHPPSNINAITNDLPTTNHSGPIRAARGPWLTSGHWWDHGTWTRQEWDIALRSGHLFRLVHTGNRWALEGQYD